MNIFLDTRDWRIGLLPAETTAALGGIGKRGVGGC